MQQERDIPDCFREISDARRRLDTKSIFHSLNHSYKTSVQLDLMKKTLCRVSFRSATAYFIITSYPPQ